MSALDNRAPPSMSTTSPQNRHPIEMLSDTKIAEDLHVEDLDGAEKDFMIYVNSLTPEQKAAEEKALLRKIDLHIIPTLFIMMVLNYLDRNALASARLQGLPEDLNLQGTEFNTAIAVLFAGYICFQVPANMILAKSRPSIFLPTVMILWGAVSACTAACNNFVGLVICRFFLGVLEAPFAPGCFFLLSCWYNKNEIAKRTAWLFCGNLISGALGGLVAAGVQYGMDGVAGFRAWRWLFILEGGVTIAFAIMAYFTLPDYPEKGTRWLQGNQKLLAQYRLSKDHGAADEKPNLLEGAKMAAKDPICWCLALMMCCKSSAGAVTQFLPTIVATFGYSRVTTLLMTAPPYVLTIITSLVLSYTSDRVGERGFHIAGGIGLSCLGYIMAAASPADLIATRYLACFLSLAGLYGTFNAQLAWISTTLPHPKAKRAAAYAIVNSLGNLSQIWAPYLFPSSQGSRYITAFATNSVFCVAAAAMALLIKFLLRRRNRVLEEEQARITPEAWEAMPETEKDMMTFRYVT